MGMKVMMRDEKRLKKGRGYIPLRDKRSAIRKDDLERLVMMDHFVTSQAHMTISNFVDLLVDRVDRQRITIFNLTD
jgi:hypothetical protein